MNKNIDKKGRWRDKIVSFRMSPEEAKQLDYFSRLSGLTKQDYLIRRSLQKDIVVNGNPRVYKALHGMFNNVLEVLEGLEKVGDEHTELLELIAFMSSIMDGLKGDSYE